MAPGSSGASRCWAPSSSPRGGVSEGVETRSAGSSSLGRGLRGRHRAKLLPHALDVGKRLLDHREVAASYPAIAVAPHPLQRLGLIAAGEDAPVDLLEVREVLIDLREARI